MDAIRTSALVKSYERGKVLALNGLDLHVPEGSVFGFLGPNGAGKTTAIKILTGLVEPTSGEAWVAGEPVAGSSSRLRSQIGYLSQDPRFYSWMTGRELLVFAGRALRRGPRVGPPARRRVARTVGPHARGDASDRRLLRRHGPAARNRPGHREHAAHPLPRRAVRVARPARPARRARVHRPAARQDDGPHVDAHPRRRGAGLRHRRASSTAGEWSRRPRRTSSRGDSPRRSSSLSSRRPRRRPPSRPRGPRPSERYRSGRRRSRARPSGSARWTSRRRAASALRLVAATSLPLARLETRSASLEDVFVRLVGGTS